jgi:LPXTG-motif cell wall-anchored protein
MASGFLAHLLQEVTPRQRLLPVTIAILLAAPATARGQATTICHATGDPNTPYQQIDVAPEASIEHLQHADDIVPAPAEGCPAQLVTDEVDPAAPLPTVTAAPQPDVVPTPQARKPRPRARKRRRAQPAPPRPASQAAPAVSQGDLGPTATVHSDSLPMTGAEIPAIALMGLGFLLAGAGLRLRYDWR